MISYATCWILKFDEINAYESLIIHLSEIFAFQIIGSFAYMIDAIFVACVYDYNVKYLWYLYE